MLKGMLWTMLKDGVVMLSYGSLSTQLTSSCLVDTWQDVLLEAEITEYSACIDYYYCPMQTHAYSYGNV